MKTKIPRHPIKELPMESSKSLTQLLTLGATLASKNIYFFERVAPLLTNMH